MQNCVRKKKKILLNRQFHHHLISCKRVLSLTNVFMTFRFFSFIAPLNSSFQAVYSCPQKKAHEMLHRLIILVASLQVAHSQQQCSGLWQYLRENGQIIGLLTLPPQSSAEHKMRLQLSVGTSLNSVS
jgi:hypothetical protein